MNLKQFANTNIISSVSHLDKLSFTKHLSTLLKAGIPLPESLKILKDQAHSTNLKKIIGQLEASVSAGQTLSSALKKHPQVFESFYVHLIKIGEESGNLDKNLIFLSQQLTKNYLTRKKVQGALLYPGIILTATLLIGAFIAYYILPQLISLFESFDTELPLSTVILLFVASTLRDYGFFILIGTITLVLLITLLINNPKIKPLWHRFLLNLPLFGSILRDYQQSQFNRNMGVLIQSGTPIDQAIETTSDSTSNLAISLQLKKVLEAVKAGKPLGKSLEEIPNTLFPTLTTRMISVGEESGNLADNLLYLADFYDESIDTTTKNLSTILEPILLIIIGLFVGFVALSIISPIYQLTGSIRR